MSTKELLKDKKEIHAKLLELKNLYYKRKSKDRYQIKMGKLLAMYDGDHLSFEYNSLRSSEITDKSLNKFKKRVKKMSKKLEKHYRKTDESENEGKVLSNEEKL